MVRMKIAFSCVFLMMQSKGGNVNLVLGNVYSDSHL